MKKFLLPLLLALVVLGVYAPTLRNGFVWDDTALILRDPFIRSWRLIPEGFQHFLFTDATASDFYRPMQRLSYTLDYALAGLRPAAYHLTSIVSHAAAALALYLFALELLATLSPENRNRQIVAFIGALIWAIHPLQTSAVAYISGRADPLAAFFGFAALYCGLRSLRLNGAKAWGLTAATTVLFLLSLLSKEAGIVFIVAWLAIIALARARRAAVLYTIVGLAVVCLIYAVLRTSAEHHPAPPARSAPALVRPILMARAVAEYAGLVILPLQLHMDRNVETQPFGLSPASTSAAARRELQTLLGVVLVGAFLYWLLRERKRDRAVFVCLLLAAAGYIPISGLFVLNANVAEHWLYLPTAFLFLGATLAIFRTARAQRTRILIGAIAAAWVIFLSARTFVRTFDWHDQRTFLERTIASGGNSARMLINLGGLELNAGDLDVGRSCLERALQKDPEQPLAVINRAAVAVKQGDFPTAHALLARATDMPLVAAQAHELLAVLENKETGNTNLIRMRLASRTGAPNWSIEKRYVRVLDESGATEAAIAELKRCLETQWYRADSWILLSELLRKAGHEEEARAAIAQAHRYDVHLSADAGVPGR